MSENRSDRVAIQRWEGEGGRALAPASAVEQVENVALGDTEAGKRGLVPRCRCAVPALKDSNRPRPPAGK
jgi:hypothetical protein